MKNFKWSLLSYLMLFAFQAVLLFEAGAKIQLEPYLGYGSLSYTEGRIGDSRQGAILGGLGGLRLKNLMLGLDYHTGGVYKLEKHNLEFAHQMFGAGLSYYSDHWRIWLGYYSSNKLEDHAKLVLIEGTGVKVALGFRFKSRLSVNIEWIKGEFSTKSFLGSVVDPTGIESSQTFLSISAPVALF